MKLRTRKVKTVVKTVADLLSAKKMNDSAAENKVAIANYKSRLAKNIKHDSKSKESVQVGPLIVDSGQVVMEKVATAK